MSDAENVVTHYTHGHLLEAIVTGMTKLGKTSDTVTIDDLGPVDEFHIGGRVATESFLDRVGIQAKDHVLDVGCGLGGASRFAAQRYGCQVTGIDLTQEYIEAGRALCSWVGLENRARLEQGNATAMPFADDSFDRAYMLHVGMNIADKSALAADLFRVLKPGGTLGIYDVMHVGNEELSFPVPWANTPEANAAAAPDEYKHALEAAGFRITAERNRREFALEFFARLQADTAAVDGPPPLGLHILMGEMAPVKIRNMIQNISNNQIAPIELIAESVTIRPSGVQS